ncbi:MAG: hypothetical protein PHI91_00825 [Candidatus Pacebacteria bacterium]|nr:hypothetical protein [Candidatus Paceibacterota bacterium]MDD3969727.1 hypothetical protein [Candidatus Paceibacterota bacterium]
MQSGKTIKQVNVLKLEEKVYMEECRNTEQSGKGRIGLNSKTDKGHLTIRNK